MRAHSVAGRATRRSLRLLVVGAAVAVACGAAAPSSSAAWAKLPPSATQAIGGAVSVFPIPGTPVVSPQTEISFRGVLPGRVGAIGVVGSRSGRHTGTFFAHADGRGVSFVPSKPFLPGERVTVTTRLHVRGVSDGRFTYTVARPAAEPVTAPPPAPQEPQVLTTFRSQPSLQLTAITVTKSSQTTAPGLIFLAPRRGAGQAGLELLDGDGNVVWFQPLPQGTQATDFREQTYQGRPVLTWWQGQLGAGHGYGYGVIADDHYHQIATVHAGDGYEADLHEFQLTSANTAFVTAYHPVHWNLSSVGGPKNGLVYDCVVQEVEVGTGRVLFEWHALGSVPLSSTYAPPPTDGTPLDFFHVNAIDSDAKGDVLVSSRSMHTVFELDGRTGAIHWRLGGKHSNFTLGPGVAFNSQHDAKWLDASTLSIFDNGAGVGKLHESQSRGIVLHIDRKAKQATLVRELPQPLGKLEPSQGDVEQLPNGDWFLGWGQGPYANEFGPDGSVLFELQLTSGESYRAYKYPWHAQPDGAPSIAVGDGSVAVSWNGATEVASWQLLTGADAADLTPAQTVAKDGFETTIPLTGSPAYVAVRALDASGVTLATSDAVPTS